MSFPVDRLVITPDAIDISKSPLAGTIEAETRVLGAFNPGLTVLPSGNLLLMVRVAEGLKKPIHGGKVHAIRWDADAGYTLDAWPLELADTADPRRFVLHSAGWKVVVPTSLSWLLPVELSADGLDVVAIHYDKTIAPEGSWQSFGIEDPRISRIEGRYWMTTGSVSPERQSVTLYMSENGLDWDFQGIVLDHQNTDMALFEGLIDGKYWAQTRPLGESWYAYSPDCEYRPGPSINLAASPDALHWQPCLHPGIRPHAFTKDTARIGGGTPPIMTEIAGQRGWLTLWHGAEPHGLVGIYRTYWSLLHPERPWECIATQHPPLMEPNPDLTRPLDDSAILSGIVFTTGIVEREDHFIVASGEAELACRITHLPKDAFKPA
ncbi:glycosidase [Altericroceibacterium xinjiangense]|uniref:glycoside hydrolase family 130 protein n=1 Tax=Altericroceibacterium xinjiangense TaxID=762261 RepID=UPI000F7E3BE2|nr:glycosidase [Altericroceibacterium xinjiangense]